MSSLLQLGSYKWSECKASVPLTFLSSFPYLSCTVTRRGESSFWHILTLLDLTHLHFMEAALPTTPLQKNHIYMDDPVLQKKQKKKIKITYYWKTNENQWTYLTVKANSSPDPSAILMWQYLLSEIRLGTLISGSIPSNKSSWGTLGVQLT